MKESWPRGGGERSKEEGKEKVEGNITRVCSVCAVSLPLIIIAFLPFPAFPSVFTVLLSPQSTEGNPIHMDSDSSPLLPSINTSTGSASTCCSSRGSSRRQRCRCFLSVFFLGFFLLICLVLIVSFLVCLVYFLVFRGGPSVFGTLGFAVTRLDRPEWFLDAMKERHITGLDGGVEQRIPGGLSSPSGEGSEDTTASLWLFGDTSMNCSVTHCGWGWSMVNNAAMIVERRRSDHRVIRAGFPVTPDGFYTPQVIPKEYDKEGSIWGGGFTIDNEMFAVWASTIDWNGVAQGSGNFSVSWNDSSPMNAPVVSVTRARPDVRKSTPDWPNGPAVLAGTDEVFFIHVRMLEQAAHTRDAVLAKTTLQNIRSGFVDPLEFWLGKKTDTFKPGVDGLQEASSLFPLPGPGLDLVRLNISRTMPFYAALLPDWLSGKILVRTAEHLTGPWSRATLLMKVEGNPYSSLWHPDAFDDSELHFTYCGGPEYIPYFVEVTLNAQSVCLGMMTTIFTLLFWIL